jgi:hypothetical protein
VERRSADEQYETPVQTQDRRFCVGPPIPVIDLIILPQSSHGVGVFIR